MNNQEYLAARIALGLVNAYDIQDDVNELMNEGVFFNEFIDIIDSQPPTLIDVLDPYKKFLNFLNISMPTQENAILIIVDHHTERIVNNKVDELKGLENLSTVFEFINHSNPDKKYGKELGLHPLMDIYFLEVLPYSHLRNLGIIKIKKLIVQESKRWRSIYLDE